MKDRAKKVIAFEPPCWCPDSAGTTSRLTMFNNDELVIENFRHVIYSDDERVSVKTRKGILNIYRERLQIAYYASYEVKICGSINSVDWLTV